jgi:hypothetical protein
MLLADMGGGVGGGGYTLRRNSTWLLTTACGLVVCTASCVWRSVDPSGGCCVGVLSLQGCRGGVGGDPEWGAGGY